jgi:uncharacterized membrane protein YfcA
MEFPVSGIEVFPLIPPLVAFGISFLTSMGGVTGAFLLLPFQMSVLGFTSPAVSATNLVYNLTAIPGGVYRFILERRMSWPLVAILLTGSMPGIFIGPLIRVQFLPDPKAFKLFVGLVLLFVGGRLLLPKKGRKDRRAPGASGRAVVNTVKMSFLSIRYTFNDEHYAYNPLVLLGFASAVGIISGVYGIGGGALVAPFLVAVIGLPVYTVAGACLLMTFINSGVGALSYAFWASQLTSDGMAVAPVSLVSTGGRLQRPAQRSPSYLGAPCLSG